MNDLKIFYTKKLARKILKFKKDNLDLIQIIKNIFTFVKVDQNLELEISEIITNNYNIFLNIVPINSYQENYQILINKKTNKLILKSKDNFLNCFFITTYFDFKLKEKMLKPIKKSYESWRSKIIVSQKYTEKGNQLAKKNINNKEYESFLLEYVSKDLKAKIYLLLEVDFANDKVNIIKDYLINILLVKEFEFKNAKDLENFLKMVLNKFNIKNYTLKLIVENDNDYNIITTKKLEPNKLKVKQLKRS